MNAKRLFKDAIAYLNVDITVHGKLGASYILTHVFVYISFEAQITYSLLIELGIVQYSFYVLRLNIRNSHNCM